MGVLRRIRHEVESRAVAPVATGLGAIRRMRRMRAKPPRPPIGPPLRSGVRLRALLERYYYSGRTADGARPVAWVTSGAPVEVLRPLGYYVVYPENHAAVCGASHKAQALCEAAEQAGHSRDLCSYFRTDLGAWLTGDTPLGRLPKPDLLVCCTNICQTVVGWYRTLARETGAKLVVVDTPFLQGGLRPHQTAFVRRQVEAFAAEAERVAGCELRMRDLEATLRCAQDAAFLWGECLGTARRVPAPWVGIEAFFHMAPIVALRGLPVAVEYYRGLLAELRERVERGIAGIEGERVRLLWDNLPVWPELRRLGDLLAYKRANFVAATYTHAWSECADLFGVGDPFEAIAVTYSSVLLNRDLGHRARGLADLGRRYRAHGVLFHADRSCKPYSLGQQGLRDRLAERHGVPGLVVEADHSDPRQIAWEAIATRIEAFLEGLA